MAGQEARVRVLGIVGSLGARSSNLIIVSDEPITRAPESEEMIRDVLRRLVDGVREARQGSG